MPVRIEDICAPIAPINPNTTAQAVFQHFCGDPTLLVAPIVIDGTPLGQISRVGLSEALAGPNGHAMFSGRAIGHLMNRTPVIVEAGTPVAQVAKDAADNGSSALTDGVIVLQDGHYRGMASPHAILTAIAQENTARARAMQVSNKRLDEARQSAMDMARDKSKFLAFLGHEIRTPLTGILGVADLMQAERLSGDVSKMAKTISASGHHLDRLLSDLLDLSRLEAKKLPINPEPFVLRQFAGEVRDLWQQRSIDRKISLKIEVDSKALDRVEADATRLRQILFNLVSNAIKFTDKGQVAAMLSTEQTRDGHALIMTVSDTGCGISGADKQRLFEDFEQASVTTATTHGGSGLGLSISKGLATRLGGTITLADNPGGGSIFTVRLPVRKAGPRLAVENKSKPKASAFQLGELLLVEDHQISAYVIERALTAAGWTIDVVKSGEQGLRRAMHKPYQAILSDIHLPDMNGDQLVRTLREQSGPNQAALMLAVTADLTDERRKSCTRAGFDGMIEKPIRPRAMVAALADAIIKANAQPALRGRTGLAG